MQSYIAVSIHLYIIKVQVIVFKLNPIQLNTMSNYNKKILG